MKIKDGAILLLGSAILAFGLYNVHSISNITEGGATIKTQFERWKAS